MSFELLILAALCALIGAGVGAMLAEQRMIEALDRLERRARRKQKGALSDGANIQEGR